MERGSITLPAEAGMEKAIRELADKWGIDAVRDSDGTQLSDEITNMGFQVYGTLCLIREDLDWAKRHMNMLQQMYLMTEHRTAFSKSFTIELMSGFYKEQFKVDGDHDPKEWWEVIDRTTGEVVDGCQWEYDENNECVTIKAAQFWHAYTVTFLVYQIWEPVSMYNHITNKWTEEHRMPLDPRHPEARERLLSVLDNWLTEHSEVDVVRFTSFFYNFDLIYNEHGKNKHFDWCGYLNTVSPQAILDFQQEYGYKPRPEDFADAGYFNSPFRNPSRAFRDWMEFQQKFITSFAKECVAHVHHSDKKAIMFLGDHWIGVEPYGKYFEEVGLDGVVGSIGDGVWLRMTSDIPAKMKEGRFMPYFFPDLFGPNSTPVKDLQEVWVKARRAMLQSPLDRMGFGGYLSLAVKFPEFIDEVAKVCDQFRMNNRNSGKSKPAIAPFKVAVLNAWGKLRSWQAYQVSHYFAEMRMQAYYGILEALSGLSFEVEFISFDDIREDGIGADIGVIINAGDAGTAWSGGEYWADRKVVEAIREWVHHGGGFIGVGDPTAYEHQGRFFQLSDVLGVQKEIGYSLRVSRSNLQESNEKHFITEDTGMSHLSEGPNYIYPESPALVVLKKENNNYLMTANRFGAGRAVYFSGLPYSFENARLLHRALYWAAGKEEALLQWFCTDIHTECVAYPEVNQFVVINNSNEKRKTKVYKNSSESIEVELDGLEARWMSINLS